MIMGMGPKTLIIKKGEHGALLFQDTKMFYCPALPLEEVFDPTGAGDTFLGALAGYLASLGKTDFSFDDIRQAVVKGSILASFTCEEFSTRKLQSLTHEDIATREQLFKVLTDW